MSFKQGAREVFIEGRGGGRGLPKTDADVLHEESEKMEEQSEGLSEQEGLLSNDAGARPIYATGEAVPFYRGRGEGRGHGPDLSGAQPKDA